MRPGKSKYLTPTFVATTTDYPTGVSTGAASVTSTAKGKVYGHSPASGLGEGGPDTAAVSDYSVP